MDDREPSAPLRDRERRRADGAVLGQVDEVAVGLVADALPDQPDEVGRAARHLEADQVGAEQALEQLAPPRQLLEELRGREGDVEEEAYVGGGYALADQRGEEHEVVVVYPDNVAGLDEVKEDIRVRMLYPFQHPDLAARFGIQAGGGVLLYGPPGTGKTMLARATAGE